ncbi:murein biosynthesis integral membrane protein MurJ [Calothrix sp. PCC 6303]|uniref:murein biosynthesis integral membrane protein MurJ n=1 Tax=Calothrix sp. PCC 6303 TaxID=1170562 RepID=UPI0002A04F47|nr:lipid II flippase MurJ [Calothrix sp. PCC 6303]AFZ00158.1 virulence factor MVIN family protein [Calothrix sp. PCC 6303]
MTKKVNYKTIFGFWNNLTSGSTNRKIFGSAVTVILITAFVKIVTIAKELIVAWKFGIGDALDCFLIAYVVPAFIINVVAGSFNAALIPTYIRVREQEGKEAAQELFSGATFCGVGVLVLTTVLLLISAPLYLPKIATGFSLEKLDLTFQLLYAIAPVIILSGVITVWGAILNAGERFALTSITPIITPTTSVLFLLLTNSLGAFALTGGLLCGTFLEVIVIGFALHKQGTSVVPRWYGFNNNLRHITNVYRPIIAGACLISSAGLVDDSMAAMLAPGSVAALSYGNKLTVLPINLAVTALRTVVTPYFSKMIAHEDWAGVRHTLKRYLSLIFATTLPLTIFIILFSQNIIKFLLEKGSFTASDAELVSQIQACFALQIPFYIANILVVILINSLTFNHVLVKVSIFNLAINISLNFVFIHWMGIKGIALSTSCIYMFCFSYLLIYVIKKLPQTSKVNIS